MSMMMLSPGREPSVGVVVPGAAPTPTHRPAAGRYDGVDAAAAAAPGDARASRSLDLAAPTEAQIQPLLLADSVCTDSVYTEAGLERQQLGDVNSAAAERLGPWCQRIGMGWLAKTFDRAGYWSVGELRRAKLTEDDLKKLGVNSLSERRSVMDALAEERRDTVSMDIINTAISSSSLEMRFDAISRASERELVEQQMRQSGQNHAVLPSIERQRRQQQLGGGAALLEVWLAPLDLYPGQKTAQKLRGAGLDTVDRLLEANCSERQLQGLGLDKPTAASLAVAIQLERLSHRSIPVPLVERGEAGLWGHVGYGGLAPVHESAPSTARAQAHGPRPPMQHRRQGNRGRGKRQQQTSGTARRARERASAATERHHGRIGAAVPGSQTARQPSRRLLPNLSAASQPAGRNMNSHAAVSEQQRPVKQGFAMPILMPGAFYDGPGRGGSINISAHNGGNGGTGSQVVISPRLPPMRSLVPKPPPPPEPEPEREVMMTQRLSDQQFGPGVTQNQAVQFALEYRGSDDEATDLREFYLQYQGDVTEMPHQIPCAREVDTERLLAILDEHLELELLPKWATYAGTRNLLAPSGGQGAYTEVAVLGDAMEPATEAEMHDMQGTAAEKRQAAVRIQAAHRGRRGRAKAARREKNQRGKWTRSDAKKQPQEHRQTQPHALPYAGYSADYERSKAAREADPLPRAAVSTDPSSTLLPHAGVSTDSSVSSTCIGGVRTVSPTVSEDGFEYREVTAALSDEEGLRGGDSGGETDDDGEIDEDLNKSMRLMNRSIMTGSFRTDHGYTESPCTDGGSRGSPRLGDTLRSVGFSTVGSDTLGVVSAGLGDRGSDGDRVSSLSDRGSRRSRREPALTRKVSHQQEAIDRLQAELLAERRSTQAVVGRLDKSERAVEAVALALAQTQDQLAQTREALRTVQTGGSFAGTEQLDLNESMGSTLTLVENQIATKAQVSQVLDRLQRLDGGGTQDLAGLTDANPATVASDGGRDIGPKLCEDMHLRSVMRNDDVNDIVHTSTVIQ